ncbi:hypothetical protein ABIE13_004073 [Ottowia thiooxydans]|uniref:Uncharacterized protein n=1 Tax=Ottowia thiooxydans TaxID=219182 RepID=A0ABV2QD30_9BURK
MSEAQNKVSGVTFLSDSVHDTHPGTVQNETLRSTL